MKLLQIGIAFLLISSLALCEQNQFTISGSPDPSPQGKTSIDDPETQNTLIAKLKLQAVQQWLQKYLGERFNQFETLITPDFGEKYILEYKVNRNAQDRNILELQGQLDTDSLRSWVRIADSKKGNVSNRAIFFMTASVPGLENIRTSQFASVYSSLIAGHLQKQGVKLVLFEGQYPLESPPQFSNQIDSMKSAIRDTSNLAIWTNIKSCPSCNGGMRIDSYLYSLETNRIISVDSEDLSLSINEMSNLESSKTVALSVLGQTKSSLDSAISQSKANQRAVQVLIEGIDKYRLLKLIEQHYSKSDFASQVQIKKTERQTAELEIMTHLAIEDVAQRIQTTNIAGMLPKVQRIDPKSLIVRYSLK